MYTILFCSSYPDQPIGYSRIANFLSNVLAAQPEVKLYYFGFSNFEQTVIRRYIHPNITFIDVYKEEGEKTENFGTKILASCMDRFKPDMLFIYNDLIVTCRLFNALLPYKQAHPEHKYKVVVYIDLVYKYEKQLYMEFLKAQSDYVFVFGPEWKKHLVADFAFDPEKVFLLPHGFCSHVFKPVNKTAARKALGLGQSDFIICNSNRNTYRKMLDLTVEVFCTFLAEEEMDPTIKLLLNCASVSKSGYDLIEMINIYCKKLFIDSEKVLMHHVIMLPNSGNLTDEVLNLFYNASDLGLNTCCGEGFGLCNLEGACLGVPQVVNNVGGLKDIFANEPLCTVEPIATMQCTELQDCHWGQLEIANVRGFVEKIKTFYHDETLRIKTGQRLSKECCKNFNWNDILDNFVTTFHAIK